MAPASRPDSHLNLNYLGGSQPRSGTSTGSSSPNEVPTTGPTKSPFGGSNGLSSAGVSSIGNARLGAGSPSHDLGGARLYSRRAREIQAQEGVSPNIWGPPTSGNSTPLRENIPESPNQDEFPDLMAAPDTATQSPARRTRAGTVPSRFSPVGPLNGVNTTQPPFSMSKSSRPTPSTSPFRPQSMVDANKQPGAGNNSNATLMSRLRAGSMPQRPNVLGASSPFGPSVFSTNWTSGRERASTLSSIRSSEGPTSPTHSKDGLADADVRTLDYLGLAETPQQARATLAGSQADLLLQQQQQNQAAGGLPPLLADLAMLNKNANRFRSYSVNAKEKYAEEDDEQQQYGASYADAPSGTLTPTAAATAAQLAATQAQIHQHNLAVQAFANHASASRPRARTAGVLDTPPQRSSIRNYLATPSKLDNTMSAGDVHIPEGAEYDEMSEAVQMMNLGGLGSMRSGQEVDENNLEGPTRALWIGSIPVSITVTSLDAIFSVYGKIESTRVLTHKNCGFVNFERVESAIQAKSLLNGKEIFPGAGPVRIGYAKVPTSPASETPGPSGSQNSPQQTSSARVAGGGGGDEGKAAGEGEGERTAPHIPPLADLQPEIAKIVTEFGASESECHNIAMSIQRSVTFSAFVDEIPPIPEPSQVRKYDAPRLRDIRKRIDNGACTVQEIEDTALDMLPEIAELSSDYLGNTVVQKLFEYCSEDIKEKMLVPIAPRLAEIGVHKNGTWAGQKVIDVAKTPTQKQMIVESIRPYTVPLFLDQYGNYVLQCCLRFGPPYDDYIFETMLSRMWEIAQGRFGARAMRACLESHHATKDQQRMLAAAIALHGVQLATNANGALLLTWYLDTCTFPNRRSVLAPRLVPHLVQLCTHKVAYLTVLKIVNQRNEPEAREIILKALFFSPGDEILESILKDPSSGATLIFKVLTTPFFEETMRAEVVKTVAKVLTKLKTSPSQGYKRLMDEVGLSSRGGQSRDGQATRDTQQANAGERPQPRPPGPRQPPNNNNSNSNNNNFVAHSQTSDRPFPGQLPPNPAFDSPLNMSRTGSSERGVPPYGSYGLGEPNGPNHLNFNPLNASGFGQDPVTPMNQQQLQYQAFLASQGRGVPAPGFYPPVPNMPNGFTPFGPGSTSMDALRGGMQTPSGPPPPPPQPQMSGSPMPQQPPFAQPQYSPAMNTAQLYNYPQQFYPQQPQGQPQGGRRGRR